MAMNLFPAFLYVLVETCVAKAFVFKSLPYQTHEEAKDPSKYH